MFTRIRIMKYTKDCSADLERLKYEIETADSIVIGAGAGLSTAAGLVYNGENFTRHFTDFEAKYDFHDMYSGGFYPYKTQEEHWAYWSRYINLNRYEDAPKNTYDKLLTLVRDKDYFVLTTNVDHCFQKAGFDKKRLFYTQGDYGLFQCSEPCCRVTYDNEEIIRKMVAEQRDMHVPSELIPYCPVCGKPMRMNLRSDNTFVQDSGFHAAHKRYLHFVREHENDHILYLELGVGYNTPNIVKYPFWRMTAKNPDAVYACVNFGDADVPDEIAARSIYIRSDVDAILHQICLIQHIHVEDCKESNEDRWDAVE